MINKTNIQLIDIKKDMCIEWFKQFKDHENVTIHNDDIFALKTDCVVSPANSFGFMDGGLDLLISKNLGWQIEEQLQVRIKNMSTRELLVGQAELIETGDQHIPFCIVAPTMRVPMIIKDTVNTYLASKAVFILLKNNPQIRTISISGLGTGVGRVPYDVCAKQMYQAFEEVWLDDYKCPETWREAQNNHQLLYTEKCRNLQYSSDERINFL